MYKWRNLTDSERLEALNRRVLCGNPWHSPPHDNHETMHCYLISAACYEHQPIIGINPERMADFEHALIESCESNSTAVYSWCILPNHYHVILRTNNLKNLLSGIGKLHGRTSFHWNGEEKRRGRKVWFRCCDRRIRNVEHFWTTVNYVHHNPVHHGYTEKCQEWPYSSAQRFLASEGRAKAIELWLKYPADGFSTLQSER